MNPQRKTIAAIWNQSANGVIGRDNKIPHELESDLPYFKQVTMGSLLIMGRRTWESIGCKPLPGRQNAILSSQHANVYPEPAAIMKIHPCQVSALLESYNNVFFIGGSKVYELALPLINTLIITRTDIHVDGDTFAPPVSDLVSRPDWYTASVKTFTGKGGATIYQHVYRKGSKYDHYCN